MKLSLSRTVFQPKTESIKIQVFAIQAFAIQAFAIRASATPRHAAHKKHAAFIKVWRYLGGLSTRSDPRTGCDRASASELSYDGREAAVLSIVVPDGRVMLDLEHDGIRVRAVRLGLSMRDR